MLKKLFVTVFISLIICETGISAEIPTDAKLDYNQGIDFYKLGMYERAMECFRSAIKTYPDYIDAYYNLGTVLEYIKHDSEALSVFKQVYLRNPNDYEVIYKIATISVRMEDYDSAKKFVGLIPNTSEYFAKGSELLESIDVKIKQPTVVANPTSNIATHTGVYENINSPTGITTDKAGNIYVATFSDNTIVKITPENKRIIFLKDNRISGPISLVTDSIGNIYVANYNTNNVLKITPQGVISVLVDKLNKPYGLHVNGNMLFITCQGSNSIFRQKI